MSDVAQQASSTIEKELEDLRNSLEKQVSDKVQQAIKEAVKPPAYKRLWPYTGIGGLVLGMFFGSWGGVSTEDHNEAVQRHNADVENLQRIHTAAIQAKDAEIARLQRQPARPQPTRQGQEREVIKLAENFHHWTTVMLLTTPDGKRVLTAPYEYFATMDFPRRRHLFNEIVAAAPHTMGPDELNAFYGNNAYARKETGMFPRKTVLIPVKAMDSPEKIEALDKGLNAVRDDLRTYAGQPDTIIAFRFDEVAGRPAGPGQTGTPWKVVIRRDIGGDKRADSGIDDMRIINP